MLIFVPSFIPALVQAFPLVYLFCYTCAGAPRKHPLAFYLPWAIVVAFVSWGELLAAFGLGSLAFVADYNAWLSSMRDGYPVLDTVLNLFTSSVVGVSFYLIVMLIGACEKTKAVKRFYSIRSEMPVLGGIIKGGGTFMSDFAGYVASAWIYAVLLVAYPVLRPRRKHRAKPQDLAGKTLHELGAARG